MLTLMAHEIKKNVFQQNCLLLPLDSLLDSTSTCLGVSTGISQIHSYTSSPVSLYLQEQFPQHITTSNNNRIHFPSFQMSAPPPIPYLGMNISIPATLCSMPCSSCIQSLPHHTQLWNAPPFQASDGLDNPQNSSI